MRRRAPGRSNRQKYRAMRSPPIPQQPFLQSGQWIGCVTSRARARCNLGARIKRHFCASPALTSHQWTQAPWNHGFRGHGGSSAPAFGLRAMRHMPNNGGKYASMMKVIGKPRKFYSGKCVQAQRQAREKPQAPLSAHRSAGHFQKLLMGCPKFCKNRASLHG